MVNLLSTEIPRRPDPCCPKSWESVAQVEIISGHPEHDDDDDDDGDMTQTQTVDGEEVKK